jgi:hypothetical protein
MPVGNLLYDSISRNTGDIAMGIAANQLLAQHGVPTSIVDPLRLHMPRQLVIGGGELLRPIGDPLYDVFRQPGAHILNAVGVWDTADDLDYLKGYAHVSARSTREVDVLRRWVPQAELVPCATTMLRSEHYDIPGTELGELLVGIHMVPHALRMIDELIPLVNAIPHKKVFIPFTHYNGDASFMRHLPFDKTNSVFLDTLTPMELHSVLGQMSYVIVSSLHASIFAYSQNVPFASVFQQKTQHYFDDRGLEAHIVADRDQLQNMVHRLDSETFDFSALIKHDSAVITRTFAKYADILQSSEPEPADVARDEPADPDSTRVRGEILLTQAAQIIVERDVTLAGAEMARLALVAQNLQIVTDWGLANAAQEKVNQTSLANVERRLALAEESLARITRSWWWRVARTVAAPTRRALRSLATIFQRP